MAAVLDPGDEVLVEQPAYGPLLDVANYLGVRVKRLPRRFEARFAIGLEELERAISTSTRLIVLTNLHNPSGALLSGEMLQAIGKMAHRAGVRVLVDEVYLEMLFGKPAPYCFPIGNSIAGASENPFIVTSSLTKVYGLSGLRCGWILAAPDLARRMWLLNDLFSATGAHPAERLSVMALSHLEQFRERARALLTANRALLDAFLDSRPDIECFRPPARWFFPGSVSGLRTATLTLFSSCFAKNMKPRLFPAASSRCLGISVSASVATPRPCAPAWNALARPSTPSPNNESAAGFNDL